MPSTMRYTFRNPLLAQMAAIASRYGTTMKGEKLKAFVPTLEDVDEAHRDLYVEDTDPQGKKRFKLDADGLEDVTGLKSTVAALRKENKDLKERTEPLAELGEDADVPAILAAGKAELDRRAGGRPIPEVESTKIAMTKAHEKAIGKVQAELDGALETLNEVMIANEVRAVAGDKDIRGNAKLLLPLVAPQAKLVKIEGEDGKVKYVARILGPDKKERLDGKGEPLSIKALVAELRENDEYSGAFDGTGSSGSGAPPEGGSGMPTPPRNTSVPTGDAAKQAKRSRQDYGAAI